MMHTEFPELAQVDRKSWKFRRIYLWHCLRYPFFFFTHAPVRKWYDLFGSTHRVALDCARAACALENEPDKWCRNALRHRFLNLACEKAKGHSA